MMSALMVLELEENFKVKELMFALKKTDASIKREGDLFRGEFNQSGMEYVLTMFSSPSEISAEGLAENWHVGSKIAFHIGYENIGESWSELKKMMSILNNLHSGRFVLTFQYETVYALKDSQGYALLKSPITE